MIRKAIALNKPDSNDLIDAVAKVSGPEICGIAGIFLAAAALLVTNLNYSNRSIQLSSDGGALSSDTGELICREFDEKLGLCLYRNNLLLSKTDLYLLLLFAR